MKSGQLYWYASCSQCRDARKALEEKGIQLETRDFFKERFTEPELRTLLEKWKLKPRQVFSFKSPSVKAMHLQVDALSDDEMLRLMVQEPRLIRRPLMRIDGTAMVGFDKTKISAL
jgi:Spx/MgsR family transcriptional regulator